MISYFFNFIHADINLNVINANDGPVILFEISRFPCALDENTIHFQKSSHDVICHVNIEGGYLFDRHVFVIRSKHFICSG